MLGKNLPAIIPDKFLCHPVLWNLCRREMAALGRQSIQRSVFFAQGKRSVSDLPFHGYFTIFGGKY